MSSGGLSEWGDIANIIIAVASVATAIVTAIVLYKQYELQISTNQPLFRINVLYEDYDKDNKTDTERIQIYNDGAPVKYISSPSIRTLFLLKIASKKENKHFIKCYEFINYCRYGKFHKNLKGIIRDGYAPNNLSKYQTLCNDINNYSDQDIKYSLTKLFIIKIEYIDVNGVNNVRYFANNEPIKKKQYNKIVSMIENTDAEFSISTIKAKDLLEFTN